MGSFAFQQESIRAIVKHFETKNRALCADEAGMGKTFIARGVIEQLAEKHTRNLLDDPAGGQIIKSHLESWWKHFCEENYKSTTSNIKQQRKSTVRSFIRTVTQNRNWDFTPGKEFKELLKSAISFPDADTDLYIRFLRELPKLFVMRTGDGAHMPDWDFKDPGVPFPLAHIIKPFRVLYVCCNLAIAEQNAQKLVGIPQVHMNRSDVASDRLSILWDAMDRAPTPYLEIYPITSTVSTRDTQGTAMEFDILKKLKERNLATCGESSCDGNCKKCGPEQKACLRISGEKCSLEQLKGGLDLIVFDEFQNFGDIITMLSKDTDQQNELLVKLKKSHTAAPPEQANLLKNRIQSLERIQRIIGTLYSDDAKAKTLFLSATPFHDVDETDPEQYRRIGFKDLVTVLGGSLQEFEKIDKNDLIGLQDFLYKSGFFRNERRQLLAGNEQRTVKEYELCCPPTGLLSQAVLLQKGQITRSAILTTPNFASYAHLYTKESTKQYAHVKTHWSHGRYEELRKIVCAIDAEQLDSKASHSIGELLWIPPCHPTTPLRGVFETYRNFSKTLVFSKLFATPLSIADQLNTEFSVHPPVIFENEAELIESVNQEFFEAVFGQTTSVKKLAKSFVLKILSLGVKSFPSPANTEAVLQYCRDGCLFDVLREFKVVCENDTKKAIDRLTAYFKVENDHLARVMSILEEKGTHGEKTLSPSHMQKVFNTPFWPFVAVSTTVGAEGLDFHSYCNRLVHYTIPPNVITLEQMNGRIDRMDSLAVRRWWSSPERSWDVFSQATLMEKTGGLSPHWDYGNDNLHYYYLYTEGTGEKQKLDKMKLDRKNYRAALGAFSDDISHVINLSPFMRTKK